MYYLYLLYTFHYFHSTLLLFCFILGDPRVSALRYQGGGTETESIRTEDFESAFQKSLPAGWL